MQIDNNILICPYCGQLTKIIWVHGHGQCMFCKTNFDECCRGESMNNAEDSNQPENDETKEINSDNKIKSDEKD